ncbi:Glycosidase [Ignavibacterium album JCM 16511]|uniref:Glycosidase n=1 Tax=Ignavibacterium album (strain DSM 19864 / JCM 16511 / NBRC 101810 / Mat9-16) TaxID=945713 RepID=I0AN54_IGNAJ|nr:glycoside hydrolase family 13 protein [Ignavibacterium album]AFH50411.1 Glycosidase [Ignavibacterium album JCM 16511]
MNRIYFVLLFILNLSIYSQTSLPDWSKGIVWYQIFPERFYNGDTTNDPTADKVFVNHNSIPNNWHITKWTSNWFERSEWEYELGGNFRDHLFERRYGGDIQGIINKLDYLNHLGIKAIYLNPVFEAVSLHKYDASCYHHIDFNFGPNPIGDKISYQNENPENPETWQWTESDKLFLKLIEEVHKRGMKIIIDGVFNHVGIQFWAFQDLVKNQFNSKYKDWFIVEKFDDPHTSEDEFDYKGWWNIKSLPEFNRTTDDLADGPKKYIFNSTRRWMDPNQDGDPSDGVDGWRLDVAREVPLGFWRQWSKLVKSINKDAILIGELWELSPDFISENGVFDALMNYNFAFAVNDFFVADKNKISVSAFVKRLEEIDRNYPATNLFSLQNLLTSHDTERLISLVKNPDRKYDRDADERNKIYDPSKPSSNDYEKEKMIIAFQFIYKGAPMIFYGDEIGMWGADDPHCRKPMIWSELSYDDEVIDSSSGFSKGLGRYEVLPNFDLYNFYKKMISIRNNNLSVRVGGQKILIADDDKKLLALERFLNDERIIAVFNLSEFIKEVPLQINFGKEVLQNLLTNKFENKFPEISGNSFVLYKIISLNK